MADVIHIVDPHTPQDMLRQLALLVDSTEPIASAGPAPRAPWLDLPIQAFHRPLGIDELSLWPRALNRRPAVLHAWSMVAARAAIMLTDQALLVLSVPCVPRGKDLASILEWLAGGNVRLTVPTSAARQAMLSAGAPETCVHVLPVPARPIEDALKRRCRVREELGLTDEHCLLVAPAEMIRYAGQKYASWVHAVLMQIKTNVRLLLPGGGPLRDSVRFFAATTGYDDEVFLTEDRFDMADCLAAGDIGLFLFERDCGLAAMTATMAGGLPIAASRTPDILEYTASGQAAMLAQPGDPRDASATVLRLIDQPQVAADLAAAARRRASEFHCVSRCRAALEDLYAALPRRNVQPL